MIKFNAGASRPADDDARLRTMDAAKALVQRTLAQNGLMPSTGDARPEGLRAKFPSVAALSALKMSPLHQATALPIPDDAEFRSDTFTCPSGSRAYRTYVPSSATQGVTGLIVMLHGCTQTPEDFAAGTGMNALAEAHRFIVAYPQQSRGDNAQSCWNWFSRLDQRRGRGEPAILAGITRKLMADHGIDRDSTFVAGLSAGAAMAVILGETYPDLFAAVGAHSGLPYGVAQDVPSAFAAMAGSENEPQRELMKDDAQVRTIVFHGTADMTVHPTNSDRIATQARGRGPAQTVELYEGGQSSGRSYSRRINSAEGQSTMEYWVVDGLGHAWSGGSPKGSYTDPRGPDASAEMVRFFFNLPEKDS